MNTMCDFQTQVAYWATDCFGTEAVQNFMERNLRFLEEAVELVQACGLTREQAVTVMNYVYNSPVGNKHQELGGVLVTLATLAHAHGMNMSTCANTEITRCYKNITKIRAKQKSKPFALRGPIPV